MLRVQILIVKNKLYERVVLPNIFTLTQSTLCVMCDYELYGLD